MIAKQRNYIVQGKTNLHALVQVNPIGELDVEIVETHKHHHTDFENLSFKRSGSRTLLVGRDAKQAKPWQVTLASQDADELNHLIQEANEEFETLMRDL
ncbi:hypothetical protein [Vibrio paucivorans]